MPWPVYPSNVDANMIAIFLSPIIPFYYGLKPNIPTRNIILMIIMIAISTKNHLILFKNIFCLKVILGNSLSK